MIPHQINQALKKHFKTKQLLFERVGGGSINETYSFHIEDQKYFLKYNSAQKYPKIIEHECEGLAAIKATESIETPEVILADNIDGYEILVLPFIQAQKPNEKFWEIFGKQLAAMHQAASPARYGWNQDNYLGSLPQLNSWESDFISFWINNRIRPQLALATSNQLLNSQDLYSFESLFKQLHNILPTAKPALVHGDLWSGNFIANHKIGPVLIDPAIHYSNAETDIAFTHLFGGFNKAFYQTYFEINPVENGFNDRIGIYNLYPLLLHLNLFGKTYYSAIKEIIKAFH